MTAAKDARESAAGVLYGKAFTADRMRQGLAAEQGAQARALNGVGGNVQVEALDTPGLRDLMTRPMFKKAAQEAKNLAADFGIALEDPTKSLQGLHYIKLALDDMSQTTATSALGKNAMAAAGDMKKRLADELAKVAPMYGNARTTFQQMSEPINQMQIGRALMDKAAPALADFGALGRETAATFATAMRNGDDLAAKATGFPGAKMDRVLTPQQFGAVEGVGKDLARKANAQDLGRGVGSDTFQKFAMQNIAEQSGMPRLTRGLLDLPGVSRATNWMYRDTDQQVQGLLGEALLEPKKAAELMKQVGPKFLKDNPQLKQILEQSVIRTGGLLGMGALASAE